VRGLGLADYFTTQLLRTGASPEVVRLLAGHEDLETTQR